MIIATIMIQISPFWRHIIMITSLPEIHTLSQF